MKKLVRVKMWDRFGPNKPLRVYEYVVNKKYCERLGIPFSTNPVDIEESLRKLYKDLYDKVIIEVA